MFTKPLPGKPTAGNLGSRIPRERENPSTCHLSLVTQYHLESHRKGRKSQITTTATTTTKEPIMLISERNLEVSKSSYLELITKTLFKNYDWWFWNVFNTTLRDTEWSSWIFEIIASLPVTLRASPPKILIFNFHPEIDFPHNSSINFTWQ